MTELYFWQTYWFFIIGAALFIFTWLDGFDLGIGMTLPFGKTSDQRGTFLNVIWPVWDGNELYGLIGGGAIFATFPVVFAGLLSGMYPWIVLLLVFVMLRPVSFEAWLHDLKARRLWEYLFMACSFMIPFLVGVTVGATIAGLPFNAQMVWDKSHSFLEALSPFSITMGCLFVLLSLLHGNTYLIKKTTGEIADFAKRRILPISVITALAVVLLAILAFKGAGDLVNKPLVWVGLPIAFILLLGGLVGAFFYRSKEKDQLPFFFSTLSIGGLWIFIGSIQFPTWIRSSISSTYTLTIDKPGVSNPLNSLQFIGILGFIALAIVLVYSILVYRIFKGKVDLKAVHY